MTNISGSIWGTSRRLLDNLISNKINKRVYKKISLKISNGIKETINDEIIEILDIMMSEIFTNENK